MNQDYEDVNLPPQALEAEQSVLGSMMLDQVACEDCCAILRNSDFYRREHKHIFEAIAAMVSRNTAVDMITVCDWLSDNKLLDDAGGMTYVGSIVQNTPNTSNVSTLSLIHI